jgi:hypothetical protein
MAQKLIAVDGCTLNHKSGSIISGGTFTVTSVPDTKAKCSNKGIYKTPLLYTFLGGNCSTPACVPGSVATTAPQSITATASKTKASSILVMRLNDFGTMTAEGTLAADGVTKVPVVGIVEISVAGQTKALSE